MMLYHLTPIEHVEAIKRKGIAPSEMNEVFTITDLIVADSVARSQLHCDRYGVFVIHPAYVSEKQENGLLDDDDVAELTASCHVVIYTDEPIPPKCILHLGNYETSELSEWDRFVEWILE